MKYFVILVVGSILCMTQLASCTEYCKYKSYQADLEYKAHLDRLEFDKSLPRKTRKQEVAEKCIQVNYLSMGQKFTGEDIKKILEGIPDDAK